MSRAIAGVCENRYMPGNSGTHIIEHALIFGAACCATSEKKEEESVDNVAILSDGE